MRDFVRASGDTAMAKDFWPSMKKAYEYCLSTDEDGDGLMDNTKAGAAAVETGALRRRDVLTDVFLGAAWTEAAEAAAELAEIAGDPLAAEARTAAAKARASLNKRFLDDEGKRIYFAWMKDGKGQSEPTVWPGFGLWRGVFDASRPAVAGALDDLAGAGVGADWGARMLSIDSALYEPLSYNNGASWPFLTGFAALALYANGRPDAAWAYLDGTADLTFLESRGYMAELFSGDRLRSIDAAVPHQLFATTGFMSTLMRGLVGLSVKRAGTRDGQALPDRLVLAPQLPAGWGYLRVRNVRFRGVTVDLDVTRDEFGISVAAVPRWGTVPLELQATMAPGATPQKARTTKGWKPLGPQDGPRGPRMWRFDEIFKPEKFSLESLPGIEVSRHPAAAAAGRHVIAAADHRRVDGRQDLQAEGRGPPGPQLPAAHVHPVQADDDGLRRRDPEPSARRRPDCQDDHGRDAARRAGIERCRAQAIRLGHEGDHDPARRTAAMTSSGKI